MSPSSAPDLLLRSLSSPSVCVFVLQALMMGEPFFDCQVGVVGCRAVCLKGIMGIRDFEENMNRKEEVIDTQTASQLHPHHVVMLSVCLLP